MSEQSKFVKDSAIGKHERIGDLESKDEHGGKKRKTSCNGICLAQATVSKSGKYYRIFDCKNNCVPKKCPNYVVCGTMYPECLLDAHRGVCYPCDKNFFFDEKGTNRFTVVDKKAECPLCKKETNQLVKLPLCDHQICSLCVYHTYYALDYKIQIEGSKDEDVEDKQRRLVAMVSKSDEIRERNHSDGSDDDDDDCSSEHESAQSYIQNFRCKCPFCAKRFL